jgi:hypothetical protein
MTDMHYLQREFHYLFREGNETFEFFKKCCLDGMSFWDIEHLEDVWFSPGFWHALGYDPAEMPHKAASLEALIQPDDLKRIQASLEAHLADPACPYDVVSRYKHGMTGDWVWMRCWGLALRDATGTPVRMIGAHVDVTSLKETEDKLRATVEDLREARGELENALQANNAFLEAMSYEIRTPMNGILGMAEALMMKDMPLAATTQVAVISRSARSLLSLLNEGLEMAQSEARKALVKMEALNLKDVIRAVLVPFETVVNDTGRALVTKAAQDLPERVMASTRMISDVLTALVANAVTHARHGDIEVQVRLTSADMPETRTLRISVVDTGIGLSDTQKAAILQKFAQSDLPQGQASSDPGLGLVGLVAARKLCQQHGGDLGMSNTPGGGTTVEAAFVVHDIAPATVRIDASGTLPKGAGPLRILVVEDDKMNQLVLEAFLSYVGADIVFACDVPAALDLVRTGTFDAGFVDTSMPVMSGTDFAAEWRRQEAERGMSSLPLIACSGHVLSHQVENCIASGFDRHLPKPITMEGLLGCIDWIWSQRALPVG